MEQYEIDNGSKKIIITHNEYGAWWYWRLWVNNGETATLQNGKTRTLKAAEKKARKVLGI